MRQIVKKSGWGKGLFALYGGFVVFILALVVYVSQRDIHLVEKDYYQKELDYQEQIDRLQRTQILAGDIEIEYSPESYTLTISYPPESLGDDTEGTVELYRPSSADLDRKYDVSPDIGGQQVINVGEMAPGLWRVRIGWGGDSEDYFSQKMLIIP